MKRERGNWPSVTWRTFPIRLASCVERMAAFAKISVRPASRLTRQTPVFRIDSRPCDATVRAAINAAADVGDLEGVTYKDLVAVAWIDKDAGEVAERKISAATVPRLATVV